MGSAEYDKKTILIKSLKVRDLEKKLPNYGTEQRIELLKIAADELGSTGDEQEIAHIMLLLGNVYSQSGQPDDASYCFGKSADIFGKLGDLFGEAASLNNLGFVNKTRGDINSALNNYEKSLSIYRSLGDKDHECIILLNIANLYYSMGEYLEAIEYFEDSLEAADKPVDAKTLYALGSSYSKSNDHRRALEYLEKALAKATESGDKQMRASILKALTATYLGMGDVEKAGNIVEQNEELFKHPYEQVQPESVDNKTLSGDESFNSLVSKDVRTSLTSVIGYAQHIKANHPDISGEDLADMMNDIEVSALTINELISNLDAIDAVYSGKIEPKQERIDLTEIVSSALNSCSARISSKHINAIFKASGDGISLNSDRGILEHIMNNLISNAVRSTPPGKNIYAYVSRDGEIVRCEIIDEGSGLSESEAGDLINGVTAINGYMPEKEGSEGIGLSVANSLTKLLGGELRCENMLGKGSAFVLELPDKKKF